MPPPSSPPSLTQMPTLQRGLSSPPTPRPILPATPHLFFVSTFKQKCRCYLRMLFVISAPPSVHSTFCLFCSLLHI